VILTAELKEATKGPILLLDTSTWIGCKAKSSSFKGLTPKVKACSLRLRQAAGESKAKGSVATECTVETSVLGISCTVHVLPEKESEKINFGLEKNALENSGSNLIIKAEDSGITTTVSGAGCKSAGVTGSKENKQKGTVTGEGVNFS
jgi:hypothetical protein